MSLTTVTPETQTLTEIPVVKKELPVEKKFIEARDKNDKSAKGIKDAFDKLKSNSPGVDLSTEGEELDQLKTELDHVDLEADQDIRKETTESPFKAKLSDVKASSKATIERLEGLLKGEPTADTSSPDALESLAKTEGLTPGEYIKRSSTALEVSERLREQLTQESRELEKARIQSSDTYEIDQRLRTLGRTGGLKKISAAVEGRRLNKQKASMARDVETLSGQIKDKSDSIAKIQEQEKLVKKGRQDMLLTEVSQAVRDVKIRYEQLLHDIVQDGTIPAEVRNAYIRAHMEPNLQKMINTGNLTEDDKSRFYQALTPYLDGNDHALYEWSDRAGFYSVDRNCEALKEGRDLDIVKEVVASLAAQDIDQIRVLAEPYYDDWSSKNVFSDSLERTIEPMRQSTGRDSFDWKVMSALRAGKVTYPDMTFWQALKDSPSASGLFEEFIKAEDERIFSLAVARSLNDTEGGDIDKLSYYPRPEAIKNLVILAAADTKSHRTYHANGALTDLAKRSDWGQILDQAEQLYPSLKSARPFLEHWDFTGQSNKTGIQEAINSFALDMFENKVIPSEMAEMALTNESILGILVKRGILSEQEVSVIRNADITLKRISAEAEKGRVEDDYSIPYISGAFNRSLRENMFSLLDVESRDSAGQGIEVIKRFETLSQAIIENKTDYEALAYLSDTSVIERIKDLSFKSENLPAFLVAYKTCPELIKDDRLLGEFCRQFQGEQTVVFFADMAKAYQRGNRLNKIINLVGEGQISKERALELPEKYPGILSSESLFSLATEFPRLFLETDDGLTFLIQRDSQSLFSLDKGLDMRIGEKIRTLEKEKAFRFTDLISKITSREIEQLDKLLSSDTPFEASDKNWQQLLMGYIRVQSPTRLLPELSQVSTDRINDLFSDPKVRDLCLNGLRNSWIDYLKSGKPDEAPFSLRLMSKFINYFGGAGPLSQIDSLNLLITRVDSSFSNKTTVERTKLEISQGLVSMEERFTKEKWSNEDRTDFYNISRDVLEAAPSLFSDYLALFRKLTPSQLRSFSKDIYPLYRTKLVLLEKRGVKKFDKEQLLDIRKDIRGFAEVFSAGEKTFESQRQKLFGEIKGLFTDRFGIIKIPQELNAEHMRSFTNVSTYLANLHGRTSDKEAVLGFYMSLMLNDRWDDFRKGESVDPSEFLTAEKSSIISKLLEERQKVNPLIPENLGIPPEDMPEFLKLLQQETQSMVIGNIETIDVKLGNILLNLQGLEDLDLYPDALDKKRMQLLSDWGNKKIGSVVARMYQGLATPVKEFQFSEEDIKIREQITRTIQELGLDLNPQTLKQHFQDGIKPLATVVNLLNFVKDTHAESEIEALRNLLKPSKDVIEIFGRLGEDFKPTSGAMALSQDLSYLDNLIVKREDELKPQEKELLSEYTANIREQMVKLETIYSQIRNKFGSLKQGNSASNNPLLTDKLDQIDKIVNAQTTQQAITSTTTNNLNVIMENIRECLSCTREGCNNDTDLTFGDMNKFYLYSQTETQQKGSISDELVFVEPVVRADGSQEVAFVLDRIYGTSTPTILENQIEAVLKKYRSIKQRFPGIKLSVFVSDAAISTGGISSEMLLERFKSKNILGINELVEVNVAESAAGDHYIEFGGEVRTAGKREVNGIIFSL